MNRKTFTDADIQNMLEMLAKGHSTQEVGAFYGVSYNTIYHSLTRRGFDVAVPMRNLSHQKGVDFSHVSEAWWSEFRGFFYGEGSVSLRGSKGKAAIALSILLRGDDSEVLVHIHEVLGGTLRLNQINIGVRNPNPYSQWVMSKLSACEAILLHLEVGLLPAKKRRDISLALEFCSWRLSQPRHLGPELHKVQEDFVQRLKDVKVYRPY